MPTASGHRRTLPSRTPATAGCSLMTRARSWLTIRTNPKARSPPERAQAAPTHREARRRRSNRLEQGRNTRMRFGYFDDKDREYVITTPKTPYPWINYLGSENFFALVSHRAGGYCFYRDARLRRLMRYRYNNVPTDVGGRYFYINDGGDVWNPSFAPTNTALDAFECRHGLGYTRITGERKGVRASLLMLFPLGHTAEIHQLTIKNESSQPKNLKVFSFIEWCLWNAYDDMTNYQ